MSSELFCRRISPFAFQDPATPPFSRHPPLLSPFFQFSGSPSLPSSTTTESAPWPVATFHVPVTPGTGDFCKKGGRFGAHAATEGFYGPYYGKLAIFSWFNAGTRIFDIRDPYGVQEVAYFIPAPNKFTMMFCPDGVSHPPGDPKINSDCARVIQTNNVEVDDRGFIYSTDRAGTGLHIIRLTGRAKDAVTPAK